MSKKTGRTVLGVTALAATVCLSVVGIKKKKTQNDYRLYENQYSDILKDSFKSDKVSYKRLMEAIKLYNKGEFDEAIEKLEKLRNRCVYHNEHSAVLMFMALCYTDLKQYNKAINCYEELLRFDAENSRAWSNLGFCYNAVSRTDKAGEAYLNALEYDKQNPYAYNNLAIWCLNSGQPEEAVEHALKALSLNNRLFQAMGAAALGYAYMGYIGKAKQYLKMYGENGGNMNELGERIQVVLNV